MLIPGENLHADQYHEVLRNTTYTILRYSDYENSDNENMAKIINNKCYHEDSIDSKTSGRERRDRLPTIFL